MESTEKRGRISKAERTNRLQYIAGLFRKGQSKLTISETIQKEWGIKGTAAAIWIRETYKYLNSGDEAFIKNLRRIQLERLEYLLMKTIEKGDYKTANQICDTINKTFALYEIKQKVELSGDNIIQFKFADGPVENPYKEIDSTLNDDDEAIIEAANNDKGEFDE